jgi:Rrf2 family protein
MALSTKVEYALLALLKLTEEYQQDSFLSASEIANAQNIPMRYLDQILIVLQRQGIIASRRGVKGGYSLARQPEQISFLDVVLALETKNQDETIPENSTLEEKIVTEILHEAEQCFQTTLKNRTLADLSQQLNLYKQDNYQYYI